MDHPYAEFIHRVDKPARYLGGEYQAVKKDWSAVEVRFCLAFPDVYDIGMSHLGTKILYAELNRSPRIACERAFAPWPDLERELRARGLPLVSLESARPLRDFDAIGCSLQYELTYTNVLTLLDLGGIPLRAADRGEDDPLVWGGGPTATHPEPVAPFFDCLLIGEAEEALPRLLLLDAQHRRQGLGRRERLARLAAAGAVYVPSLYATRVDPRSGLEVVDRPLDPRAPRRVERALVEDINKYPFPDDTPVAWAEAVFDRVSVEIARGCTEGCRFCQAGMIYRPVRERDPDSIVESLVGAIRKGGYDEASLTSLSTADFSCITPLVKKVATRLREDKVALSVSSLRAYGLNGDLLDEMAKMRAGGLTFAPEAGSQRMRDVINKNVTDEDITRSAENVFQRGFDRMKLYFMIGLPTETDEDVRAIAQTGARLKRRGRQIRRDAEVVVSVSSHVPKPHTPFQWCAMDPVSEIQRKQRVLKDVARLERVDLKYHDVHVSWLEAIFARGDRRLADTLEDAWRRGARFDGWEELLRQDLWQQAIAATGVDPARYLGAIATDGALPWDHIDIGLEDGFLLDEWQKALRDRAAPPCGKPNGTLLHHTNVEEALADPRKLVCYDCGVACDMTHMREERIVYLRVLGAEHAASPAVAPAPSPAASPLSKMTTDAPPTAPLQRGHMRPRAAFVQGEGTRYRVRYTKLGRAAYISHLDTSRLLGRLLRRAELPICYTRGFHPKPDLSFGPALGLGIASLGELVDVRLDGEFSGGELALRLRQAAPDGVRIDQVARLDEGDPGVARVLTLADCAALIPLPTAAGDGHARLTVTARIAEALARPVAALPAVVRLHKGERKTIEVSRHVVSVEQVEGEEARGLREALEWPAGALVRFRVGVGGDGSVKPAEVIESLLGEVPDGTRWARLALWGAREAEGGVRVVDPLDLPALRAPRRQAPPHPEAATATACPPA